MKALREGALDPYIGHKVIFRSNEQEPYGIGRLLEIKKIAPHFTSKVPWILNYKNRQEYVVLGAVVPYTEEMINKLDTLTYTEQWEYLTK